MAATPIPMDYDLYVAALQGTLKSPTGGSPITLIMENGIIAPTLIFWVDPSGAHVFKGKLRDGFQIQCEQNDYFLLTNELTGSFVAAFQATGSGNYALINDSLMAPNEMGPHPEPTDRILVPRSSQRVLVGLARTRPSPSKIVDIYHEQFWKQLPDSYMLAPGENRTVNLTKSTGLQNTSSKQEDVAASLGLSASAGWGAISLGISASLSQNTSTFQQVTISEETTTFISTSLDNKSATDTIVYLMWQLTNVVNIVTFADSQQTAPGVETVITAEAPTVVAGPYVHKELPHTPTRTELRAQLPPEAYERVMAAHLSAASQR